jgi:hypothetical protein
MGPFQLIVPEDLIPQVRTALEKEADRLGDLRFYRQAADLQALARELP